MNATPNPNLLLTLPKMPLAEKMDLDLLLAYRDQLTQYDSLPLPRSEMAWNNLEIGLAKRDKSLVDEAFGTFHDLHNAPGATPEYHRLLGIDMVLASETAFRQRYDQQLTSRKTINTTYRQIGSIIENCLDLGSDSPELPVLTAYGILLRDKDSERFPYPASPREKTGTSPASHSLYTIQPDTLPWGKTALRVVGQDPGETPPAGDAKTALILPLIGQAVRSQEGSWVRNMAGKSSVYGQEKKWLRYVGAQLVRDSQNKALKPEAQQVLNFLSLAMRSLVWTP